MAKTYDAPEWVTKYYGVVYMKHDEGYWWWHTCEKLNEACMWMESEATYRTRDEAVDRAKVLSSHDALNGGR